MLMSYKEFCFSPIYNVFKVVILEAKMKFDKTAGFSKKIYLCKSSFPKSFTGGKNKNF